MFTRYLKFYQWCFSIYPLFYLIPFYLFFGKFIKKNNIKEGYLGIFSGILLSVIIFLLYCYFSIKG